MQLSAFVIRCSRLCTPLHDVGNKEACDELVLSWCEIDNSASGH
jgi:hypothetical protein